MTKKLIIGVTEPLHFTHDCISTIEEFYNAMPVKLCQNKPTDINHFVDMCDGVILAGGVDIDPRIYGYAVLNEYNFSQFDVQRDYRELMIITRCFEKDIPILGICRGHQMLGCAHELHIEPDLSTTVICHQPKSQKISHDKDEVMHWIRLLNAADSSFEPDDDKADILVNFQSKDKRYLWVNSFHHQGLRYEPKYLTEPKIAEALGVLGIAPSHDKNKIIELMYGKKNRWISCQWHPEYDWKENPASHMVLSKFQNLIRKEPIIHKKPIVAAPIPVNKIPKKK